METPNLEEEGKKDAPIEGAETEENQPLFDLELEDDELESVKKSVVEAHKGKAEDELTEEIEAAKVKALEAKKKEAAPILAKMEELAKLEENKDKTETEILELASAAIAESSKEDEEEEDGIGADFFGAAKPTSSPVEGGTETPKAVDLPEEVKAKVAKYDALENDPVYKAYLSAKEANADVDFVDLIIQSGLTNNPEKITDPAYFKQVELYQLRQSDPSITDEDVAEFLEEFKEKSKIAQWSEVKSTKDALTSEYKEAKSLLATKVATDIGASKESTQKIVSEAENELKSYGGKFRSVDISEAQTAKVINSIRSGNLVVKSDGKVNVAKTVELALKDALEHDVVNAAYERGKRYAERKAAIRSGKPIRGLKVRSSIPRSSSTNPRDSFNKEAKKMWEAQGIQVN